MAKRPLDVSVFLDKSLRMLCGVAPTARGRVLDFGCGAGDIVQALLPYGYDVHGCDIKPTWEPDGELGEQRLRAILQDPYRLPFEDDSFDAVYSWTVLEHAHNKEECFREIRRVLRPGGYALHIFPSKWYLPREPHSLVPLLNFFWPHCPRWWLALWAILGIRNSYQQGHTWRHVVEGNTKFFTERASYWTNRRIRALSVEVFGNYASPMRFYIEHGYGGFPRAARRLPFKTLSGWVSAQFRMNLILQQKTVPTPLGG